LLNEQLVIDEIKEEMKMKTKPAGTYGTQKRQSKEESL
jgi:hypothetical protein